MSKCKITIWGRAFDLSVVYECYAGEEVLESQREAFAMLEDNEKEVSDSLAAIKKYVQKTGADQLKDDGIENIFKYVMPKSVFVPHTKKHRVAAIMCNYKFDMEHGIAVVFESGKLKKVGTQDIVL